MFSIEIFAQSWLGSRGTRSVVGLPFVDAVGGARGGEERAGMGMGYPKLLEIGTARKQTISSYNCQNEGPPSPATLDSTDVCRTRSLHDSCTGNIYSMHYNTYYTTHIGLTLWLRLSSWNTCAVRQAKVRSVCGTLWLNLMSLERITLQEYDDLPVPYIYTIKRLKVL